MVLVIILARVLRLGSRMNGVELRVEFDPFSRLLVHGVLMKSLGNILYPVGLVRILVRGAYIFHRQESAAAVVGNLNPKPRTLELSYHSGSQKVTNLGGLGLRNSSCDSFF